MEYQLVWAMYFAQIKGFQFHPGNKQPLTTVQCAAIADEMMSIHTLRWGGKPCP